MSSYIVQHTVSVSSASYVVLRDLSLSVYRLTVVVVVVVVIAYLFYIYRPIHTINYLVLCMIIIVHVRSCSAFSCGLICTSTKHAYSLSVPKYT